MRIILLGNYPLDQQESMERFAQLLNTGFREAGVDSEIWRPRVWLGSFVQSTHSGVGKWIGYVDKWLLFPLTLRWRLYAKGVGRSGVHFHVCDHSSAPYLQQLPANQTSITCHDVIAIRGWLGYADAHAPASGAGKFYQRWIFHHLKRAKRLAAVSQLTLNQLRELVPDEVDQPNWRVIHNAFNAEFKPVGERERNELLSRAGLEPGKPFLLHVGSKHPRKNRKLLLDMADCLTGQWSGYICYAGQPVDDDLVAHAQSLGLQNRVISVVKPDHATLQALYSACEAFVFPSFSEGFGWPVIEAQACGAPVIASAIEPLPEISGGTALHANPTDPQAFADAFRSLTHESVRADLIRRGFENCNRFRPDQMISAYLRLCGVEPA